MDNPAYVVEFSGQLEKPQKNVDNKPQERAYTFEEAITLAETGKFHNILLLVCGLCFMAVMVEILGVSLIMPSMKCDLTTTLTDQGFVASAGFLGVVMSSHAMGFLSDTWGRVKTLRYALIFSFVATVISVFSVNVWMLIVFRFLNGFFISGCQACVFSFIGEFHGNKSRVRHVTLLSMFLSLGLIYLPSTAMVILPLKIVAPVFDMNFSSWRLFLLCNSAVSLVALFGLFQLPESPKYVIVQGKHDECLEILRKVFSKNTGKPKTDYPVKSIILESTGASLSNIRSVRGALKLIWSQTVPLFNRERFFSTTNICLSMFIIYGIAQGMFMWFPTFLIELFAKSGSELSFCQIITSMNTSYALAVQDDHCSGELDTFMFFVLSMMGVAFTAVYLIFALTINAVGKKNLLICWLIFSGISCLIINWTSNLPLAVVLLTIVTSVGNCAGIVSTISTEFFPTNINSMGMCFIMMVGRLGAVAGSNIVGQTIFTHCDYVLWVFLALLVMLGTMAVFLPDRAKIAKSKKVKTVPE